MESEREGRPLGENDLFLSQCCSLVPGLTDSGGVYSSSGGTQGYQLTRVLNWELTRLPIQPALSVNIFPYS